MAVPLVHTENLVVDEEVVVQTLDTYGSVENLIAHKESHRHSAVIGSKFFTQKNFPNTDQDELRKTSNRWSRVNHIYKEIKRLQEEKADNSLSDEDCARMLDVERGSMNLTLNKFAQHLMTKHKTKQRKPKSSKNGVATV